MSDQTDSRNQNLNYRSTLAQWSVSIATSTIAFGAGLMGAIPIVVIGVLYDSNSELYLNEDKSSWFASLPSLLQPVGSILAGFSQNYMGRKSGMILMNIPQVIAWIVMYRATSVSALYVSVIMMGLSAGFMEAPVLAYIGEISQPKIRGALTAFVNVSFVFGVLVEFFFGSVLNWRTAAVVSAIFPILSIILITIIPDSPVWFLSKGRKNEALEALCWIRGWVTEDKVKDEFNELCLYTKVNKFHNVKRHSCDKIDISNDIEGNVESEEMEMSFKTKIFNLFQPSMMKPFFLLMGYQIFFHCAALTGMRSYMVETFSSLNMPIEPQWIPFTSAIVMILGGMVCILTVNRIGKRVLSLISMMACCIGCILLGIYASYKNNLDLPWIPTTLFCFEYFSLMVGISPIPWMLMSEIYPISGRLVGAGLSASSYYILQFIFTKTYLSLQNSISLHGCFFFGGFAGLIGFVFLYIYLPETEDKTLAEIENGFKTSETGTTN